MTCEWRVERERGKKRVSRLEPGIQEACLSWGARGRGHLKRGGTCGDVYIFVRYVWRLFCTRGAGGMLGGGGGGGAQGGGGGLRHTRVLYLFCFLHK